MPRQTNHHNMRTIMHIHSTPLPRSLITAHKVGVFPKGVQWCKYLKIQKGVSI
jgi:hypothetical protein